MSKVLDSGVFREVLGQYPTGVVVITAIGPAGEALGMTVGSFTSVSLDPPLVAFLPDQSSSSWRSLRESGDQFCVNVLGAGQEDICRAIASRKADKFDGIPWRPSAAGNPVVEGAVAFVDCTVEVIHEAGDHHIVVGRVEELDVLSAAYPLLFFQGGYGSFRPLSLAAGDADLLDQLRLVDVARPYMDEMAGHFDTEVTAVCLVGDELVLMAASGRVKDGVIPTRVGQRVPFMPPFGSVYAGWGSDDVRDHWVRQLDGDLTEEQSDQVRRVAERVRERGFAITCGHELNAEFEVASTQLHERVSGSSPRIRELMRAVEAGYNPEKLAETGTFELRSVSAPVLNAAGDVAFTLKLWGPPGSVIRKVVDEHVARVTECAAAVTEAIRARQV